MVGERDAIGNPEQQHRLQATGTAVLQRPHHTVSFSKVRGGKGDRPGALLLTKSLQLHEQLQRINADLGKLQVIASLHVTPPLLNCRG